MFLLYIIFILIFLNIQTIFTIFYSIEEMDSQLRSNLNSTISISSLIAWSIQIFRLHLNSNEMDYKLF